MTVFTGAWNKRKTFIRKLTVRSTPVSLLVKAFFFLDIAAKTFHICCVMYGTISWRIFVLFNMTFLYHLKCFIRDITVAMADFYQKSLFWNILVLFNWFFFFKIRGQDSCFPNVSMLLYWVLCAFNRMFISSKTCVLLICLLSLK